jgi:hypothetical protein
MKEELSRNSHARAPMPVKLAVVARAVRRSEQAASERRGEGEPVLERRSAPFPPAAIICIKTDYTIDKVRRVFHLVLPHAMC